MLSLYSILIILDLEVIKALGSPEKLGEPVAFDVKATEAKPAEVNTTIGGSGFYGTKAEDSKPQVSKQLPSRSGGGSSTNGNTVVYPICITRSTYPIVEPFLLSIET